MMTMRESRGTLGAIDSRSVPMSPTDDLASASLVERADDSEEIIPVSELAHQVKKHPVTLKRLLPPELIVYVGRTPWAYAARSRTFLLSGGKRSHPA
jgi:hypothetical protein